LGRRYISHWRLVLLDEFLIYFVYTIFMSQENGEQQKTGLESIRAIILGAPESIRDELARTSDMNDWMHCFGSCIFAIELCLAIPGVKEEIGSENSQKINQQLKALEERIAELRKNYPEKRGVPQEIPENIQEELLNSLRAIG